MKNFKEYFDEDFDDFENNDNEIYHGGKVKITKKKTKIHDEFKKEKNKKLNKPKHIQKDFEE